MKGGRLRGFEPQVLSLLRRLDRGGVEETGFCWVKSPYPPAALKRRQ